MDWIAAYICVVYTFVLIISTVGAFSMAFDANTAQRLGLTMFAVWSAWRIQLIIEHGWAYPHEPLVATAIGVFAAGSLQKSLRYLRSK